MDIRQTITETNIFTIFIFILIISGNFLAQLFPCKLQEELNGNMYIKHLFGLFTMIFFVMLAAPVKDKTISVVTLNSFLLYLLFILITKVHVKIFYVIMSLLGSTYIAVLLKQADIDKINANASADDVKSNDAIEQSNEQDKENPKDVILTNQLKIYDNIIFYSYIIILLLTIIGVLAYMGEKKLEYKKNFKYVTFFLGKTICKHSSPNIDIIKALRYSI
jgi:hypothetical protein